MGPRDYLNENFRSEVPEWLAKFDPRDPDEVQSLVRSFLSTRVVFYPGSGQDGSPVQLFNEAGIAHCFLYVDYMMTRDAVEDELQHHGFRGYSPIARLAVAESDMGANGWTPHLRSDEVRYQFEPVSPYAFLEILEKRDAAVIGASRLAILFLAADGHAAYDALFCQKHSGPAPFAIVLQDHGFGGNWSDFGAGGAMETIAQRADTFPQVLLVGNNTEAWRGFARVDTVDPVAISAMRTRSIYVRDPDALAKRDEPQTLRREALPDLIFDCPVALGDLYDVPVDNTSWPAPFIYHQVPRQGQSPRRPRAPFHSYPNALVPRSQVANIDAHFGVYMLAINQPRKAFYVGIAAADGRLTEGVGSRIRKHRVKLTASHVGRILPCGSPAGIGGVNHTGGWRPFAAERYQFHLTAREDDYCADVRVMVGTAGTNAKKTLEKYESAILHNADGIRSRIFDVFWPGEDNSDVVILNTMRGRAPEKLPSDIVLPDDCVGRGATTVSED
jgi:hypothetical protein